MVFTNPARLILAGALLLPLPGCAVSRLPQDLDHRSDPHLLALVSDRKQPTARRQAAATVLTERATQPAELAYRLRIVIAHPAESESHVLWCVDFLATHGGPHAARQLSRALFEIRYSLAARDLILEHLRKLNQTSVVPILFAAANNDKTLTDLQANVYTQLIEELGAAPWPQQLANVLRGDSRHKIRAVEYTHKAIGHDATARIISQINDDDVILLHVLQTWTGQFNYLPYNPQRVAYASALLSERSSSWRQRLAARVSNLRARGSYHFKIRDTCLIDRLDEEQLSASADALRRWVGKRLSQIETVTRRPSYLDAPDTIDERFEVHAWQLSVIDLWTMRLVLESLAQPKTQRRIANLIAMDDGDNTTEWGGLCTLEGDRVAWRVYPPLKSGNDTAYIASDQLLADAIDAICHFHLHVARYDKTHVAGPGPGDLRFAAAMDANALVITDLGNRRFNVDYYNAEKSIVDLGIYFY